MAVANFRECRQEALPPESEGMQLSRLRPMDVYL
jgi:hypothetical protein